MAKRVQDIRTPSKKARKQPSQKKSPEKPEKEQPTKEVKQDPQTKREKAPWRGIQPRSSKRSFAGEKTFSTAHKPPRRGSKKPLLKRKFFWIASAILFLLLIFLVSTVFAGADINVEPRQEKSAIDGTFTAVRNSEEEGGITYQVMALSDSVSTEIPATQEQEVKERASGQILVYNSHSSASQRLIKNTRFETSDGKIYKIDESVVVPGTTVENGEIVPGSIEVTVYADEPGEEYNIGLTDFTIPGFKGDPRFETFYARSKTEIDGGFSGTKRSPAEDDLNEARQKLEEELREGLSQSAFAQKPEGFTLYQDALDIVFDELTIEESGRDVTVTQRGTLQALIFNTRKLETFIAEQSLASYEGAPVRVPNLTDLDFTLVSQDTPAEQNQVQFTLSGGVTVVWEIDKEGLQEQLAGLPKGEFQRVLADYPNINRAEASIRPFWKRSFPDNAEDIDVKENREE